MASVETHFEAMREIEYLRNQLDAKNARITEQELEKKDLLEDVKYLSNWVKIREFENLLSFLRNYSVIMERISFDLCKIHSKNGYSEVFYNDTGIHWKINDVDIIVTDTNMELDIKLVNPVFYSNIV